MYLLKHVNTTATNSGVLVPITYTCNGERRAFSSSPYRLNNNKQNARYSLISVGGIEREEGKQKESTLSRNEYMQEAPRLERSPYGWGRL